MRILFILFALITGITHAQKSKTQAKAVDDLVTRLSAVRLPSQPTRLAIVPFISSSPSSDAKNTFGEYLTELVIGKIDQDANQFKLFERSRLDAIFKENELMLSGMMNPSEAIRIGQLLPIDALFSGTYTKLKSYVDISGRLIDVTTGEILTTYTGRIKMTGNIKTLFPDNPIVSSNVRENVPVNNTTNVNVTTTTPQTEEEACKIRVNEFKLMLTDFSTPEKVDAIANEAMKTPFDNICGKLHYEAMYAFNRYKVQHEPYRSFLLTTLDKIALPSQDDRSLTIIEFLTKDHDLNAKEWTVVLNAISRTEHGVYRYLHSALERTDIPTGTNRIDAYFQLVKQQKLGLPQPTTYDHAFYQMMQGLGKNQELLLYTYERYSEQLEAVPQYSVNNHLLYLNRMYEAEANPETKTKVLRWIARYFQKYESDKSGDKLYEFAYKYRLRENYNDNKSIALENEETAKKFPESDLKLLIQLCNDKFAAYAIQTPYVSQLEDRINFCVKYGIAVPGVIPTMAEAELVLKGNDLKEQERVIKLLVQMGTKPKPLENTLIQLFDKRSLEDKELLISIQAYAMEVLGNVRTTNTKAINYMVSKVMSYNYKESDKAQEAISKIGKAAVDPLITALKATTIHDGGLRYKLVVLLGKNGKEARAAEPVLLKIQKESTNKDIQYAIEAALQAIRG